MKVDYIISAAICAVVTVFVGILATLNFLCMAIRYSIVDRSIGVVKIYATGYVELCKIAVKMIRYVAKTGLIKEAIDQFYKDIETL